VCRWALNNVPNVQKTEETCKKVEKIKSLQAGRTKDVKNENIIIART
jgi:hypothetical protein